MAPLVHELGRGLLGEQREEQVAEDHEGR
jgi:hypothetical protein